MNETFSTTQLILSLVTALGVRELIPVVFSAVFRRKEDIASTQIENSAKFESASREQILFLKDNLKEAYAEIDKMQDMINEKRRLINELSRKLYNIELELQILRDERQKLYCSDISCSKRLSKNKQ